MTPPTKTKYRSPPDQNPYLDQARLNTLQLLVCERLDEMLDKLGLKLSKSRRLYVGPCPVHGGDNPSGLNLYPAGETVPGYWRCNTRRCHENFKRTIVGFVRGVLSAQRGWTGRAGSGQMVSWKEAVDWCCRLVGQDIRSLKVDYGELEKRRFAGQVADLTRKPEQETGPSALTRGTVRRFLDIPAPYFVARGYSPDVLDRYDVGTYPATGKPLSDRVAVPVYAEDHQTVAGFTGRSVFEKCPKCGRWHHPDAPCPTRGDRLAWARTSKWYNHEFNKESFLYNAWSAGRHIRESGVAVLVEGPPDVWRLEEAGVRVGLALFGAELSDQQQVILERSGAMNLVVLTDADEAGETAKDELRKKLRRSFRLYFPELPGGHKDVGEMPTQALGEFLSPLLTQLSRRKT